MNFVVRRAVRMLLSLAVAIAQQAQSFGQNDDITVLGVQFNGAAQEALAR